ncbi:MAG: VTT domain-containing protein [Candidatus Methylacidiphilales bacterium]|nr:VTT domain-containing protein [Candidatus Methylacidiphilales bacterium]
MFEWIKWMHSDGFVNSVFSSGSANVALLILFAILFAETGLLIGFFLPGDSLLIAVGAVVASQLTPDGEHLINIWVVNLVLVAGAIIGDQVGYLLGLKTGPAIFARDDSRFFKKKYVLEAHDFYVKHGSKAIVLARFVPVMRTFVPFMAGVARMPYNQFVFFNIAGGIFWVTSLLWIGYFVGKSPLGKNLHYVILAVIFLSILPLIWAVARRFLPGYAEAAAEPTPEAKPANSAE